MARALTVATAAVAACCVLASSAPAAGVTYFKTPSGDVVCAHARGLRDMPFVECGIRSGLRPPPRRVDCRGAGDPTDQRISLAAVGTAHVVRCAGDPGPFFGASTAPVLGYGRSRRRGTLRCDSARDGLTCRNGDGAGFFLGRTSWRPIEPTPPTSCGSVTFDHHEFGSPTSGEVEVLHGAVPCAVAMRVARNATRAPFGIGDMLPAPPGWSCLASFRPRVGYVPRHVLGCWRRSSPPYHYEIGVRYPDV